MLSFVGPVHRTHASLVVRFSSVKIWQSGSFRTLLVSAPSDQTRKGPRRFCLIWRRCRDVWIRCRQRAKHADPPLRRHQALLIDMVVVVATDILRKHILLRCDWLLSRNFIIRAFASRL